jgi:phosphoribosyl-dephospho-CoA transferase
VSFSFPSHQGLTSRAAVLLGDAAPAAPVSWQPVITALLDLGKATGVQPRVFGALLWEHLTGLSYLTERPDLDLLWAVPDVAVASALLHGLRLIEASSPVRLDGEVELPCGGGVNWRELAQASDAGGDVLVKTMQGVTTQPVADLFTPAPPS